MKWLRIVSVYDTKYDIWETIRKYKTALKEIAELNRKYNIHGCYQNHAGLMVSSPVWDLYELLRDIPPEFPGSKYEVRQAMVEGSHYSRSFDSPY